MAGDKQYAVALAAERRGYVVTGRADRVQGVDAELARVGYQVDDAGNLAPVDARPRRERATAVRAPEKTVEV